MSRPGSTRPTIRTTREAILDAIRAFLIELGIPEKTADPYYLKRTGRWPIGNTSGDGGKIIASKRRLLQHADKLARGSAA